MLSAHAGNMVGGFEFHMKAVFIEAVQYDTVNIQLYAEENTS